MRAKVLETVASGYDRPLGPRIGADLGYGEDLFVGTRVEVARRRQQEIPPRPSS